MSESKYPPPSEPEKALDASGEPVLVSTEETDAGTVTHVTPDPEAAEPAEHEAEQHQKKVSTEDEPSSDPLWQ
jgi:hypothetical protein